MTVRGQARPDQTGTRAELSRPQCDRAQMGRQMALKHA
jgi:hypothetical protein